MRGLGPLPNVLGLAGLVLVLAVQACQGPGADAASAALSTARRAYLAGEYLRAEAAYQHYLQAFPHGPDRLEAWQRLADIELDARENPAQAATLLEAALLEFGVDPKAGPDLLARAAQMRLTLSDPDKASAHLQALLALPHLSDQRRAEASLQLARARSLARDPEGALAVLAACAAGRLPPDLAGGCGLRRGELLLRLGRLDEGQAVLTVLYDNPALEANLRAQAGFALAQAAEARNDKPAARALYEAIKDSYPNPMAVQKNLDYLGR